MLQAACTVKAKAQWLGLGWQRGVGGVAGVEERTEEEQHLRVTLASSLYPSLSTSTKMWASEIKGMKMLCQL